MQPLQLMITQAGYAALFTGGGTNAVQITQLGLTASGFVMAPTIDTLPGEFKRLDTIGGQAVAPNILHLTAIDASADTYDVRGFGLYLDNGTLFAVFAQATPIFRKVAATTYLHVQDVIFTDDIAGSIVLPPPNFQNPQASQTVKGVAEVATAAEASAGTDHQRFITPRTLKQLLDALSAAIAANIDQLDNDLTGGIDALAALVTALTARTITGAGLASGGGSLAQSRTITVTAASAADVAAGTATDRAVTPAALAGLARQLTQNGYARLPGLGGLMLQWGRFTATPNATSSTLFPLSFPLACFVVVPAGGVSGGVDSQDNPPVLVESSISASGFSVFSADDSSAGQTFIALGI